MIVSFLIGERTMADAEKFLKDFVSRLAEKPLFTSDELPHYEHCLLELFHDIVTPEHTGKKGRPKNPIKVPNADLDYATVHKTREHGQVVEVTRNVVFGSLESIEARLAASPSSTINTAYIERSNLDWRLWDAHLVRKGITFAKAFPWLEAKFSICIAVYNFVRPHESLSRGKDRVFHPTTPAMAAGVVNQRWSVADLLWSRQ